MTDYIIELNHFVEYQANHFGGVKLVVVVVARTEIALVVAKVIVALAVVIVNVGFLSCSVSKFNN